MSGVWFNALVSVIAISLISFVGAVALVINKDKLQTMLIFLVSFAIGGLFGDAFIHLLPEVFAELGADLSTSLLILTGILIFFVLEKFIRWRHCHIADPGHHTHPVAAVNLVGDGVHNFIDGLLIGASYLVSLPVGIATTVAVILHEIPNEIGDVGVLLHSGMAPKKVLFYNFISALLAVVGVVISLVLGPAIEGYAPILTAITAGGFIYIAGSDLVPALHSHDEKLSTSIWQFLAILLGLAIMAALTVLE